MQRFITDAYVRDAGLADAGQDTKEVLSIAAWLLGEVEAQPWIDEHSLRAAGEQRGVSPDEFNAAQRFLEHAGRLHAVGPSALVEGITDPEPADDSPEVSGLGRARGRERSEGSDEQPATDKATAKTSPRGGKG